MGTTNNPKRIGILVVHGIGEQTQFEFLQTIAGNLFRALSQESWRKPHIQIRRGDQVSQLSPTESWRLTPAIVSWWSKADDKRYEAHFRDVTWADLDLPKSLWNWWRLVGWGLGMPGVRLVRSTRTFHARVGQVCLPVGLDRVDSDNIRRFLVRMLGERLVANVLEPMLGLIRRFVVRVGLGVVSLLFFLMLISVNLAYWVLQRFSVRLAWVEGIRDTIYDYLGDVKLYQHWAMRDDESLEALGELPRAAIQRRMVRALVYMAKDVHDGKLGEYYIFAHSLGTVMAFNALMELGITLPNYFTEEEWGRLQPVFGTTAGDDPPDPQKPKRPHWLKGREAMDRDKLFKGLKGFLTMGSPLDKIATLWPAIVPINRKPLAHPVPWINVADRQDFVAGNEINLLRSCDGEKTDPQDVAGLHLSNYPWADRLTPFTAHTSYWTATFPPNSPVGFLMNWLTGQHQGRLMNCLIPWLESGGVRNFAPPQDRIKPAWLAAVSFTGIYVLWLLAIVLALPFFTAFLLKLLAEHVPENVLSGFLDALSGLPMVGALFKIIIELIGLLYPLIVEAIRDFYLAIFGLIRSLYSLVPGHAILDSLVTDPTIRSLMAHVIVAGVVVVFVCSLARWVGEVVRAWLYEG